MNVLTFAARLDGMVHVRPPTVIEVELSADTLPRASLVSVIGFPGFDGAHLAGPISTAEPPVVLPPIFPLVNPPVGLKPAERFPRSATCRDAAWPEATPAIAPWS